MKKSKKLTKPKKSCKKTYDYHECRNFLQEKYGYEERDYAGHFKTQGFQQKTDKKFGEKAVGWYSTAPDKANPDQLAAQIYYDELINKHYKEHPYQDFWHYITDHDERISNGSCFTLYKEMMDDAEPWQKEILQHYFDEFDPKNTGSIVFYVWW